MTILLTGGAGYIGTHTIIELDKAGHSVIVVDNLINSVGKRIVRMDIEEHYVNGAGEMVKS